MADLGDNNFIRYVYRGEEGEHISDEATHIFVGECCTVVLARAFQDHPNIIEVICQDNVVKIEREAFWHCPSLRRVIMPGVKIVELFAFDGCTALTDVECGMLEDIGLDAFMECKSLRSINLPSAMIVDESAFDGCTALTDVKFGNKLERIEAGVFMCCPSLERITIPLKDDIFTADDTFMACEKFWYVDLVEGEVHETIDALHLEHWRNVMSEEIDSINRILPNARAGYYDDEWEDYDLGEKAHAIRSWIRSVIGKITRYQAEHQRLLNETATTLQFALPQDIVTKSVLPFLELPSYTFGREEEEDDSDDDEED